MPGGDVATFLCSHVGDLGGFSPARSASASRGRRTLCDTLMLPFLSRPITLTCSFWPSCRCCSMDLTCNQDSEALQPNLMMQNDPTQCTSSLKQSSHRHPFVLGKLPRKAFLRASPVMPH